MKLDNLVFRYNMGLLLLVCLCAVGCGKNVKVTGTVTYSDNGEPVKSGTIIFANEKEAGRAAIQDGKYTIGFLKEGDGIPPGKYTISSDSFNIPAPRAETMMSASGEVLQVSNPTTTEREIYYTKEPETIEIKRSMTYDLKVERGSRPF